MRLRAGLAARLLLCLVIASAGGCRRQRGVSPGGGPLPPAADGPGQDQASASAERPGPTPDGAALDPAPERPPAAPCSLATLTTADPLAGDRKILWRAPIDAVDIHGAAALSRDRIAVTAAHNILVFDRSGKLVNRWGNIPSFAALSVPVADEAGSFYAASDRLMAFDHDGKPTWSQPLRSDDAHAYPSSPPLLGPDGVLYTAEPDGYLMATSTAGQRLWRVAIEKAVGDQTWGLGGGFGDNLIVNLPGESSFALVDRRDGRQVAQAPSDGGKKWWGGPAIGGLGIMARAPGPASTEYLFLDFDLQGRWSITTPPDRFASVQFVNHRGELVLLEGSSARSTPVAVPDRLHRYSCAGADLGSIELAAGTKGNFAGTFTLGADGVAYAATMPAKNTVPGQVSLVAFGADLSERWRTDLDGVSLPFYGQRPSPIAPDGVLYLVVTRADFTGELVAIQTTSPGPAQTSWPRTDGGGNGGGGGWTRP